MTMWTIYRETSDFPGKIVVRRIMILGGEAYPAPKPSYIGDSLEDARRMIPPEADHCIHRSPDDHPSIVESWL
jgi:hypothetical protein